MGIAGAVLAVLGGILGALLGPLMVAIAFGSDFRPTAQVAGMAAAGVVLASAGLFVGQILVARSQPIRLAVSWLIALVASVGALLLPFDDPIVRVIVAFVVGEGVALVALVGGALMRDRQEGHISHGYTVAKRSLDIAGSLVLLVLLTPLLVIAAIAVRLDSEGPALFRQIRVGRNGAEFWMVKLRTMAIDHDDEVYHEHLNRIREGVDDDTEYTIRIDDDPRITSVGATLRRWSLDELPNLWNVLKGSMSLVGPRPLVPVEAEIIGLENPRFTVKPGVTGLAQVRGRDSIPMDDRTRLDVEYVENRSTKLDVKILFETFTAVFHDPGNETSV
jgi:lipopolysaccharide/colanic/teichoic acid biosynthesis glycosyltransferase